MKFLSKLITLIFFIGLILTIVAFASGVNFSNLSTYFVDDAAYGDPLTYETTTTIDTIHTDLSTRHVIIEATTDDHITVTYHSHEHDTWTIDESNGTLNIEQSTRPVFFNWFNFKFASYEIMTVTIEVPSSWILSYNFSSDTGDIIYTEGPSDANSIAIDTSTGKVQIDQVNMTSLNIHLETGNAILSNLELSGNLQNNSSTGSISLNHVDAQTIVLDTETGRITVDYATASVFTAGTSTGRIQISHTDVIGALTATTSTGHMVLTDSTASSFDLATDTGGVEFNQSTPMDLRYDLSTSTGDITVNGNDQGNKHQTSTGTILLKIKTSTGDITISVQV